MGKRIVRRGDENFKSRGDKIVEDRGWKIEDRGGFMRNDAIFNPRSSILGPIG
jgi:hypothetical protein